MVIIPFPSKIFLIKLFSLFDFPFLSLKCIKGYCSDLTFLKMTIPMLFSASPWINASTHSLRCNIKKQRLFYYIAWSINYIKKLYNTHSIKHSEFTTKSKIAWSPSSSCATGEHAADRLVTLSYVSYRQTCNMKCCSHKGSIHLNCIGKMSLFGGHISSLTLTWIFG
jgi:WD40 repeat protein